jgi:hypothetical protein
MRTKKCYKLHLFLFLLLLLLNTAKSYSQYRTYRTEIPQKKHTFQIGYGANQFLNDKGNLFHHPITLYYAPGPRVNAIVKIPFVMFRYFGSKRTLTAFGDVSIDLHIRLKKKWIPLNEKKISQDLRYISNFIMAFNMPTGPKIDESGGVFAPHSRGAFDMKIGASYSFSLYNFGIYLNLIYAYAAYYGESYLPFKKGFANKEDGILFNIHKVIGKFIWPFTHVEREFWWKDDFLTYNFAFYTSQYFKFLLFKYRFYAELNGILTFSDKCYLGNSLDLTIGGWVKFTKHIKVHFTYSKPIIQESRTHYYDNIFAIFLTISFR